MRLSHAGKNLLGFVSGYFALTSRLLPSKWVEGNIALPSGATERAPGPVSFKQRPSWREPMDCLVHPGVQDVIVIAPTRMGKTFLLRMIFAYVVAVLRQPMLWYDSTMAKALSVSKKELQPLVERNRVLRVRKPQNPDHFTNATMLFPGAYFEMFGANSDAQSSGETCAVVLGNELGKWRQETDKEASILDQTRHRTEDRDGLRFHAYVTTPTLESAIEWIEYLEGDQRKWHVPCPFCGFMQPLEWGGEKTKHGVKWADDCKRSDGRYDMERVAETVRYACAGEDCDAMWDQDQLVDSVLDDRSGWRPTARPLVPNKRSYQLTGLYDHLEAHSMAAMAQRFLSSRNTGFIADRRDFWNAMMGMPWVDDVRSITAQSFAALERNYLRGEVPGDFTPDVFVMGFDVQTWGLPWVMAACDYSGEVHVVDWGVAITWEDLESIQDDYAKSRLSWVIGDMRFAQRRPEVMQAIYARRSRNWVAFQGEEILSEMIKVEKTNPFMGGKMEKDSRWILKFVVSTYNVKQELLARYSGKIKKTFFPQLPIASTPDEVEEQRQFYAQISSEKLVPRKRKRKGLPPDEFTSPKDNHYGDCMVEIQAMLYWLINRRSRVSRKKKKTEVNFD